MYVHMTIDACSALHAGQNSTRIAIFVKKYIEAVCMKRVAVHGLDEPPAEHRILNYFDNYLVLLPNTHLVRSASVLAPSS